MRALLALALGACQPGADASARGIVTSTPAGPLLRMSDTSGLDPDLLAAAPALAAEIPTDPLVDSSASGPAPS